MLSALLEEETSGWANLANASSSMMSASGWHWVGFYLVDADQDNLVLGPFQGPVACTRLFRGKGVCRGMGSERNGGGARCRVLPRTCGVQFGSSSEVVVPIRNNHGEVVAVLDVDSAVKADFTSSDVKALELLAGVISSHWNRWSWQP